MHSFIRCYSIVAKAMLIASAMIAFAISARAEEPVTPSSAAPKVMSTDEVNQLRIARQSLIDSREQDINSFLQNELQLQVMLKAMNGGNPSALKDRTIPAAVGIAAAGGTRYAMTWQLLQPAMEWVARVAPSAVKYIKGAPYVGGIAFAAYQFADFNRYSEAVQHMKANDAKAIDAKDLNQLRQDEYQRMRSLREQLTKNIADDTKEVSDLDRQLRPYDAYDKFEATRYKRPGK